MYKLVDNMVFVYKDWTLYYRDVTLRSGKNQRIYFFAKNKPKSGIPCDMPEGYRLLETDEIRGSGMPYITKKP